ncbi:MAG: histidinol-phosphate transaminase [Clostridia bacterium]|nr:histidinol-phosphate transaminase [Clostridia bacterium]
MSKYLSETYGSLVPYEPGEQPKIQNLIKLNTNESPFPPSPRAVEDGKKELALSQLYPDPECVRLREAIAENLGCGITKDEVFVGNGSDEVLFLAFNAYKDKGFAFPDITYGFYPVYAKIAGAAFREIPLKADFTVDFAALKREKGAVVVANPNAPTGIFAPLSEIVDLIESDRSRIVVVDEAYVDFGGESAVSLVKKYENLLVTRTFSKSRSLAGARLGFGVACPALIRDLNLLKYSVNPYNVNRVTAAMGYGALRDEAYTKRNCAEIERNRERLAKEILPFGYSSLPSKANFLFVKHEKLSGESVYRALREKSILVRYFDKERLRPFVRITIGNEEQTNALIDAMKRVAEGI